MNVSLQKVLVVGSVVFSILLNLHATAQEPLSNLVAEALQNNPRLLAAQAIAEASKVQIRREASLPNPMVTFSGTDPEGDISFPDSAEKKYEIEQSFPAPGKRGLKSKMATSEAESKLQEYEILVRDVRREVKESAYELAGTQQALDIVIQEADVLRRMIQIAETRYAAGQVEQTDVLMAQSELTMLDAKQLDLAANQSVQSARLNVLLNRQTTRALSITVPPPTDDSIGNMADLQDLAMKSRPEIQQAKAELKRGEQEQRYARREYLPDYKLGAEYSDMANGDNETLFTVGLDLPIWQRAYRASARAADRNAQSLRSDLDAVNQRIQFEIQEAYTRALASFNTLKLYRDQLIPQAEARFQATESSYITGKVDFSALLESERFLLNARFMRIMAESNAGMAAAVLERAVGADFFAGEAKP